MAGGENQKQKEAERLLFCGHSEGADSEGIHRGGCVWGGEERGGDGGGGWEVLGGHWQAAGVYVCER